MARSTFGGGLPDYVVGLISIVARNGVHAVPKVDADNPATLTAWTARTGGSQITDLLIDGAASSVVTWDPTTGQILPFQGPDGVTSLWLDGGKGRARIDVPGAGGGGSATWPVAGTPSTFPPSAHTHDDRYYTETETDSLLAAKAPTASPAFTGTPTGITKGHVGLGNVDNTSDAAKPISTAQAAVNAAKADLVGGVVPTSQIPALAISDTFTVASQSAMLALTAQRGDVAARSDVGKTFILAAEPATTLGNWVELPAVGKVQTVNGQQGTVVLGAADVGAQPIDSDLSAIAALTTDAFGRSLLERTSAGGVRSLIGAGTSDLALGTTGTTAKAGNYTPPIADLPAGSTISQPSTDSARATNRTDVTVIAKGGSTPPSWLLAGDLHFASA